MQISEVLLLHNSYQAKGSHADILGDAYLLQSNPLYKTIMHRAREIGASFTEAWPEYLLLPFHQLRKIVEAKKIPYVPSARLLQAIEDQRADALSTEDMHIPESYHLHEASHVLAEHLFARHALSDHRQLILKALLCESFANTVEALTWSHAQDYTHEFFLQQNNYMRPNPKNIAAISRLTKRLGSRFTFLFTLFAYLHANFLREKMPQNLTERLSATATSGAPLKAQELKDCQAIWKMADALDPQFRIQTTKMFLNLEGHGGEVHEVLDFDFMVAFDTHAIFSDAMIGMVELAKDGLNTLSSGSPS